MSIAVGENLARNVENLENFERLLFHAKDKLLSNKNAVVCGEFWKTFEQEVNSALVSSKNILGLDSWNIEYIGGHKFPDIVAHINSKQAFGIEVKTISSKEKSWKVMGGSIMESTRIPDVERIHVFCAKQNPFEIKYRLFEDCVENVAVTHSPRYLLDLDLDVKSSLFSKINRSYDDVREMQNPFDAFKDYIVEQKKSSVKKQPKDDDIWWYSASSSQFSPQELESQKLAVQIVDSEIQFWNELKKEDKDFLLANLLIVSPSIIEGNYNRAAKWLLQTHGIINPSFRDTFSAGGQDYVLGIKVPRIIVNIEDSKNILIEIFNSRPLPKAAYEHWKDQIENIKRKDFTDSAKKVLMQIVQEIGKAVH